MRFLAAGSQHIGRRSSQQDSFGIVDASGEEGALAIVCDGMGGMEHGDDASRLAVEGFLKAWTEKPPEETVPAALERCARYANQQVLEFARAISLVGGVGTTLVAAAFEPTGFHYISIGDSGLFLCRDGRIEEVNQHHVFANYLAAAVESGKITAQAALAHPDRDSLTSFVGAEELHEIDQSRASVPLEAGETVLLASDGLFKTLNAADIEACLNGYPPLWPEALVARVLASQRLFQDNVTVVSVTLEDEAHPLEKAEPVVAPMPTGPPPLPR